MKIKIKKLYNDALLPQYKSEEAACMDVYSYEDCILKKGEIRSISTGISVEIPQGYHMSVRPRSGLALKNGISVLNTPGTIDSDYRGEIKIILINLSDKPFEIKKYDRIAQILLEKDYKIEWEEVDELTKTKRGNGGFGHTGV